MQIIANHIKEHNLEPKDIRYDSTGVWAGLAHYPSAQPRLLFSRVLQLFVRTDVMEVISKPLNLIVHERTEWDYHFVETGMNCVIGGHGFGYEYDEKGQLINMPHLGNVVIGKGVVLHNHVCIDRAVIGSTVIGYGTKIDNLVHVAHGVKIGKQCLIVSGVVFGGSCEIGDYTFIGMNACIKQKVKIGKNCVIGAGAVVTKDVPDNQIWIGSPAKYFKDTEPRNYPV